MNGWRRRATVLREIINFLKTALQHTLQRCRVRPDRFRKTELLKWLTRSIPAHERVITIEDNPKSTIVQLIPAKTV